MGWGDDPLAYPPLAILRSRSGGRWDDLNYRFRTGYYANSLVTCFVEVLAELRPSPKAVAKLQKMGGELPNLDLAVSETLARKFVSIVITEQSPVIDIVAPRSRAEFEVLTKRRTKLKSGDFTGRNISVPRRAASIAYDQGASGIRAPSAEATAPINGVTFNIFETAIGSNSARIPLVAHIVRPAIEEAIAIAAARVFVGI